MIFHLCASFGRSILGNGLLFGGAFPRGVLLGGASLGKAKEACMILYFLGHPHNVGAASAILVFLTLMRLHGTDLVPSVPTTFIFPPSFDHSVRFAIVGGERMARPWSTIPTSLQSRSFCFHLRLFTLPSGSSAYGRRRCARRGKVHLLCRSFSPTTFVNHGRERQRQRERRS